MYRFTGIFKKELVKQQFLQWYVKESVFQHTPSFQILIE